MIRHVTRRAAWGACLLLAATACGDARLTAPDETLPMQPRPCTAPSATTGCPEAAAIDSARTLAADALGLAHSVPAGAEQGEVRDQLRRLVDALARRDVEQARRLLRDVHASVVVRVAEAERHGAEHWPDLTVLLLSLEQVGRFLNGGAS